MASHEDGAAAATAQTARGASVAAAPAPPPARAYGRRARRGGKGVAPGFSLMDWNRLTERASELNLNGLNGAAPAPVSAAEVARHAGERDCWTIYDGRVYNVTPYLQYHPGGAAILVESAGGDCTAAFDRTHRYINGHAMLARCYVGPLSRTAELPAVAEGDPP